MSDLSFKTGSVHGRFQPFHLGHLEYTLAASRLCEHLYIGITQHEINNLKWNALPEANHRSDPHENPLTYSQRAELIQVSLEASGLSRARFTITPFPIETPEALEQFVPSTVTVFTTIYDEWNRQKIELLRSRGYQVHVLWERNRKEFEGKTIRQLIRADDSAWEKLVPHAIVSRIRDLRAQF